MSDARHHGNGYGRAFNRVTIGGQHFPPIESPVWDATAEAIGEALLHERAQLPPVVLGRCEEPAHVRALGVPRCEAIGFLVALFGCEATRFVCPKHGAALERAVRRYPR